MPQDSQAIVPAVTVPFTLDLRREARHPVAASEEILRVRKGKGPIHGVAIGPTGLFLRRRLWKSRGRKVAEELRWDTLSKALGILRQGRPAGPFRARKAGLTVAA